MLRDRFTLLYRFLLDPDTNTWVDLTPQVDSRQTSITQNLCSTAFKSAKDEASFVMPETPLFEADGVTPTPKKKLIDKIMSGDDILVQINAPGDVDIQWNGEDVLWNGEHVQWRGSVRYFTGYADRSSITLRSYPLPPKLDIKLQDVSVLHLDDKVDYHILLENKKISEIVTALLGYAGYTDIGSLSLDVADDETLEAFVIDKDSAKTYRQYIDDLLFEAGGYVLDFNESGQANVVHLKWDGSVAASRDIDNPMNSEGVSMKSAYLKEDGVSVKWASLAWTGPDKIIYNADIQQGVDENGNLTGVKVPMNTFWPDGGETAPNYFQYQEERLDLPYFQNATKFKNEDVSMIMAKDIWVDMDSMRNNRPYSGWTYVNPVVWPAGNNWYDKYGIPTNPCLWPKKAFYLLYNPQWPVVIPNGTENPKGEGWFTESGGVYTKTNDTTVQPGTTYYLGATYTAVTSPDPLAIPVAEHWYEESGGIYTISDDLTVDPNKTYYKATGGDADLLFFTIHGNVLYKYKINVVDMAGSKNPKTYESAYIYNQAHAERFAQFWWHFLQTSRYQFSWSEPNVHSSLNDVVAVGVKGNNSTQKALIAGKTSRWINDNVEIISYTAVGIDTYTPASLVPISVVPSSTKTQIQPVSNAIVADLHTAAVKTLAEWQEYVGLLSTWGVDNVSDFTVGDTAIINGTISDMGNLPITLYISVSAVDSVGQTISGTGIKIEYVPLANNWDFDIEQTSAVRNDRLVWDPLDTDSYTDIHLTSKQSGIGVLEYWECTGTKSSDNQIWLTQFVGPGTKTTTGDTPILRIYKQESLPEITITMKSSDNAYSVTKKITIVNETEYDHDFAVWEPTDDGTNIYLLPDHFTVSGIDYDIIKGDYFVAKVSFAPYSSGTAVVSPSGDPSAQGWYERKGNGTGAKPYYWQKTTDTSVVLGKTYGTIGTGNQKFEAGYAYMYSGSSWDGFDITDEASAKKASNLLNDLVTGNVQIPESSSNFSMWTWAKNFAAQYAIINNLFSQAITILSGGHIKSENYAEGKEGAVCEITDSEFGNGGVTASVNESTFISRVGSGSYGVYKFVCETSGTSGTWRLYKDSVSQTTMTYSAMVSNYGVSASYDFPDISSFVDDFIEVTYKYQTIPGKGFYLGADGTFVCNNATANALTIKGDSTFQGKFDCTAIKTSISNPSVSNTATASTINSNQAQNLRSAILALGTYTDNTKYPCRIQNVSSSIAYVSVKYSVEGGGFGVTIYTWAVTFYDSGFNPVDIASVLSCTRTSTPSTSNEYSYGIYRRSGSGSDKYCYANSSFTIEFLAGGNTLTLDIPSSGSGLSHGQLFFGPVTSVGGVQCYPLYMKS